jgi:hypothetical protein
VLRRRQAARDERAEGAGGEAQRGRRDVVDVGVGEVGPLGPDRRRGGDLLDLAAEHAEQVEDVGGLLDDLAAGAVAPAPPGGRRDLVDPRRLEQSRRALGEDLARGGDGVQAAPVVAGGRRHPARLDDDADLLGRRPVQGERLLDEQRQPGRGDVALGRPVGERRDADVDGVHAAGGEQLAVARVRGRAVLAGQRLRAVELGVGDGDDGRVEAAEHGGVAGSHAARADDPDPRAAAHAPASA